MVLQSVTQVEPAPQLHLLHVLHDNSLVPNQPRLGDRAQLNHVTRDERFALKLYLFHWLYDMAAHDKPATASLAVPSGALGPTHQHLFGDIPGLCPCLVRSSKDPGRNGSVLGCSR